MDQEIPLNIHEPELLKACRTDKLCDDDNFWQLRIKLLYGGNIDVALIEAAEDGSLPFLTYLMRLDVSIGMDEYFEVVLYLYENIETSTYLKVLKDLSDKIYIP